MDGSEKRRLILNTLIDEKDISAVELAKRTKIKESTISQYRGGTKKLNGVKTLEKLASGHDEHVSVFFPDPRKTEADNVMRELKEEMNNMKTMLSF